MTSKSKTLKTKVVSAATKPTPKIPAKVAKAVATKVAVKPLPAGVTKTLTNISKVMEKAAVKEAAKGNVKDAKVLSTTASQVKAAVKKIPVVQAKKATLPSVAKSVTQIKKSVVVLKDAAKTLESKGSPKAAAIVLKKAEKFEKTAEKFTSKQEPNTRSKLVPATAAVPKPAYVAPKPAPIVKAVPRTGLTMSMADISRSIAGGTTGSTAKAVSSTSDALQSKHTVKGKTVSIGDVFSSLAKNGQYQR